MAAAAELVWLFLSRLKNVMMSLLAGQDIIDSSVSVMMPKSCRKETSFLTFFNNSDPFKECVAHLRTAEDVILHSVQKRAGR